MILEALISTENLDGSMHLSALGPHVNEELTEWTLRPFQSSHTFQNLYRTNRCVILVTDNALQLAQVVTNAGQVAPATYRAGVGYILDDCCRAFGLRLRDWELIGPRAVVQGEVFFQQELRPFWGWNRAKHAVLELAIAATRVGILPNDELSQIMHINQNLVDKTAGPVERQAFDMLREFVVRQLASQSETS